jgi:hypothetical protein
MRVVFPVILGLPFMSDSDIPPRFGLAIRWVLAAIALFVFFLEAADAFRAGDVSAGIIFAGLFAVTFVIAVKWEWLAHRIGERKVTTFYAALALACALGLGFAVGKLMGRTNVSAQEVTLVNGPADTGRIAWNFDQILKGQANFLNLSRLNESGIRVVGIGAHGRNTSNDPISEFKGYVRSDLTNAHLPIFILAEDPDIAAKDPSPFFPANIPTRPEETYGIPGLAEFDIVTYEQVIIQTGVDGVPVEQFLREFGAFTLILEYDGIKVEQKFSSELIKQAISKFENSINPQRTTVPRVTRKPDATVPLQPSLPFPHSPPLAPPAPEQKG